MVTDMKKGVDYILAICPRCSKKKHERYLFSCKMFGFIPAWRCGKCGYVIKKEEKGEKRND